MPAFSPRKKNGIKNENLGRLIRFYYLHSGHKQLPPTHGHAILTCQMLTKIMNGKNDGEIKSLEKQGLLARLRPFLGLNLEIRKPVKGEKFLEANQSRSLFSKLSSKRAGMNINVSKNTGS